MAVDISMVGRFKANFITLIDICHEMIEEGNEHNISDPSIKFSDIHKHPY